MSQTNTTLRGDLLLLESLKRAIQEDASSRTIKYFVENKQFADRFDGVFRTLQALRQTDLSTIQVEDEKYDTVDYLVPTKLLNYLNSGNTFVTRDAIGWSLKHYDYKESITPLTPTQFNAFFRKFHESQEENFKFELKAYTNENLSLEDFQFCVSEDLLLLNNSSGIVNTLEEAAICAIPSLFTKEFSIQNDIPKVERVSKWLMS